jgi:SPP1 family predicted phage head-tail adaptor
MTCPKYHSGMLKHSITFQRATRTSDGSGGVTKVWATIAGAPTRGNMKAASGGERFASARIEATYTHKLVTRYFTGLLDSDRVTFAGKAYDITFIDNVDFDDRWYVISLRGGVAT